MQQENRYRYEVDTVCNSFIITKSLAYFCIENIASYMVAIVRAIYSYLVKAHLMTISLNVCGFLPLILIQLTLPMQLIISLFGKNKCEICVCTEWPHA